MRKSIIALLLVSILIGASIFGTSKVDAAANSPYINGYSEGFFIKYSGNRILFEEYDGTVHNIAFDGKTQLMIDERQVTIKDFKKGMEIYVKLEGRKIVYMDSFSTDSPAYIAPGSKQKSGTIKMIDRNQITIKTAIGTEETYFTSPSTVAIKNGENMSLNSLYVGDRVKLHFDNIDTTTVSKIVIEGDSILIKDLYKGVLAVTNRMSPVVTFNNVEVFRNGSWKKIDSLRLPYNSDLPLYLGGQKIDYKNIENYRGKSVYIALKNNFGSDNAEKMVIKNQYEMTFSEKIQSVNWYTSQIKLSNTRNIGFHDGTMVIKNGRLVDNYSITPNSSALVVADGRGGESIADVIYIYDEDINNSNIGMDRIYAGRVESIGEYTLDLRDFFVLDKNKWESFGYAKEKDLKKLYYDNETFIYDVETKKSMTSSELLSGKYHVDEDNMNRDDERDNIRDYNAYIYTDGDRISSIYLVKQMDSLLKQTVTTATIASDPTEDPNMGMTIELRDIKDWSERLEKWNLKYGNMNLRTKDALIMKNGKSIKSSDLKIGDRLYIVRDDLVGKVIVVK